MEQVLTEVVLGLVAVVCLVIGVLITWETIVDSRDPALQGPDVRVTSYDWGLCLGALSFGALAAYCFLVGL